MNQELEKAFYIATQIAEENKHESFGPASLIKASLKGKLPNNWISNKTLWTKLFKQVD
ncbi:hypothetical protein LCGC14_2743850 [marine sediment metagenome]|uniref:HTH HARE-type domain-containing protein n=1 Tax=marine sediment metagenome TaxID=412755 RepID=A0A0F9BCN5_9ZZZZ